MTLNYNGITGQSVERLAAPSDGIFAFATDAARPRSQCTAEKVF